jgi:Phage integrase family
LDAACVSLADSLVAFGHQLLTSLDIRRSPLAPVGNERGQALARVLPLRAGTGCRIGEALGLAPTDLYLSEDDPRITFRCQLDRQGERKFPKRGSRGTVAIPNALAAALRRHLASDYGARGAVTGYVFATKTGRPLGHRNVNRELRRAQTKAGCYPALLEPGRKVQRGEVPSAQLPGLARHVAQRGRRNCCTIQDAERRQGQRERIERLMPELG